MFALRKCLKFSAILPRDAPTKFRPLSVFPLVHGSRRSASQISNQQVTDDLKLEVNSPVTDRHLPAAWEEVGEATDLETAAILSKDFLVYKNFISEEEEKSLFDEVEPHLKRLRYEEDHWDDAIHGYRETERKTWTQKNKAVLERVRSIAFPSGTDHMAYVHVLDLKDSGVIKAHIDSVKFCGGTIAGLSLLSSAVMRLVNESNKSRFADVLISRRSLYVMRNRSRYEYTHEVLGGEFSRFGGVLVPRERRVAVICRNEPPVAQSED